jgi:hypothetical protein
MIQASDLHLDKFDFLAFMDFRLLTEKYPVLSGDPW